jgi:hypothetical protein
MASALAGGAQNMSNAQRQTQVESALAYVDSQISRLQNVAAGLIVRLEKVSTPLPPEGGTNAAIPREVLCPVADRINDYGKRLENIADQIESQNNRLEV